MQQAVAEPEAQEVSTTEPARDSKKADGQCNEIGEPMIGPELGVQPGDQGSATDDAETVADEADKYVPPEPTPDEVKTAEEVFTELQQQGPRQIGAERTIEALLQIVDRRPQFVCPMDWMGEEDEEYREAPLVERIGGLLLQACPKLEISQRKVIYLWRNKEKWTSKGVTVRSKANGLSKRVQFLAEDAYAVVEVNFHVFKHMNPLQKVATIYHALRALDTDGKQRPNDFEGFFDELELFGVGTFREMVTMANALERGKSVDHPHQLSLLDEVEESEEDAAA